MSRGLTTNHVASGREALQVEGTHKGPEVGMCLEGVRTARKSDNKGPRTSHQISLSPLPSSKLDLSVMQKNYPSFPN